MPTSVERRDLEQGYRLPRGMDWSLVRAIRDSMRMEERYVPIETSPDLCEWVVPRPGRGFPTE